jgi:hypothetical protein
MLKIGRREYVQLPQLGLFNIQAKIDTGAYGCSLHCHDIEIVNISGENVLRFRLLDPMHPEYQDNFNYVKEFNDKIVKNSGGSVEHRYTITSELLIFDHLYPVEFSLTDRGNMRYPILLGRKFLRWRFVVDVSLKNLSKKKKVLPFENK